MNMNRKTIAILIELIPIVSAVISAVLLFAAPVNPAVKATINLTFVLAVLGITFFFAGRRLAKGDRTVKILGILDIFATLFIFGIYFLAIISFGL